MLNILLVEDSEDDAELLRLALAEAGRPFALTRIQTRAQLRQALQQGGWDLMVCDHHLPDLDSLAVLDLVREEGGEALPVVVMSGQISMAEAVAAMHRGARDCIGKDDLPRLLPIIEREIALGRLSRARPAATLPMAGEGGFPGSPRARLEQQLQALLEAPDGASCALFLVEAQRSSGTLHLLGPTARAKWLQEMERRLASACQSSDTLMPLEDGSFAVIVPRCGEDGQLDARASRLLAAIEHPFPIGGYEVSISGSVGACRGQAPGDSGASMLFAATAALGSLGAPGCGAYCFYTPELRRSTERRLMLESALHHAIERNEFTLHYQPQVDVASGRIVSAEALLRWQHPAWGAVSPLEFIPLLEESGLIVEVTRWVLQQACRQACCWSLAGLPPVGVAVNISASHFGDPALVSMVQEALEDSGLAPSRLELELTESAVVHGAAGVIAVMASLHRLGVRIAMDDFGAGYSSLGYLKSFPIDTLKVDRIFIADIGDNEMARHIVEAIMTMGHRLGLQVIAEGVETAAQRDILAACGGDLIQGYFFSPPVSAEAFAALLEAYPA